DARQRVRADDQDRDVLRTGQRGAGERVRVVQTVGDVDHRHVRLIVARDVDGRLETVLAEEAVARADSVIDRLADRGRTTQDHDALRVELSQRGRGGRRD